MLVLTEKLLGIIPSVYPHSCEDRWLTQKNETGTIVRCTNDFCPIKDSHKLKAALDLIEVKLNIGETRSLEVILDLDLETHMHIFKVAFEPIADNTEYAWEKYGAKLTLLHDHIVERNKAGGFPLEKFMDAWGCETLGTTRSESIFRHVHDLEGFYSTYSDPTEMQGYVGSKLGISPYCDTVQKIVRFLTVNKNLILDIAKYFVFEQIEIDESVTRESSIGDITVCITGEIQWLKEDDEVTMKQFKPRGKVIPYWEKKYGIPITPNKSLTAKTKFLINDEGNRLGKYKKIKEKDTYMKCVITTSNVFEVVLEVLNGDTTHVYSAQEVSDEVKAW